MRIPITIAALLLGAASTFAGELAKERVPSSAQWLVHLDLEQAMRSRLVQTVIEHGGSMEIESRDLARFEAIAGMNLEEDIRSVTVFSTSGDPERAVALIETNATIENLLSFLKAEMDHDVLEVRGLEIQRWRDGGDTLYTYAARKADTRDRLLCVSPDDEELLHAVDVLRGHASNLADAAEPALLASPEAGTFAFVAASEGLLRYADLDEASNVARLITSVVVQVGEHGDRAFVDVVARTADPEQATQIMRVIQGGLALVQLAGHEDPDVRRIAPLLGGLEVSGDAATVRVKFQHDVGSLVALLAGAAHGGDDDHGDHDDERWTKPARSEEPRADTRTEWY